LQYFRQHYEIIRMYMNWVKPYLRAIKRLTMNEKQLDGGELVSGFEGSVIEIETLATRKSKDGFYACGLINVLVTSRATTLPYTGEGYQRGPKHSGKAYITLRAYAWTKAQIAGYKKMRQEEDFEVLKTLDESLKVAIDTLGDELLNYLGEAGEELYVNEKKEEKKKKEEAEKKKKQSMFGGALEPFTATFSGFKELFGSLGGVSSFFGETKKKGDPKTATGDAVNAAWRGFKNYRKAHKLLTY
jgi:hypothetical protein